MDLSWCNYISKGREGVVGRKKEILAAINLENEKQKLDSPTGENETDE